VVDDKSDDIAVSALAPIAATHFDGDGTAADADLKGGVTVGAEAGAVPWWVSVGDAGDESGNDGDGTAVCKSRLRSL
jgi:hypothetical protein